MAFLPFYHIFAAVGTFVTALAWSETSVIIPGFDPRHFLEVIPKYKVNFLTFIIIYAAKRLAVTAGLMLTVMLRYCQRPFVWLCSIYE